MHPHPCGRLAGVLQALSVRRLAAVSIGLLVATAGSPTASAADVLSPGFRRQEIYRDIPGRNATSEAATLSVNSDTHPPQVASAEGGVALTSVTLRFSERLDPTDAANPALFAIDGDVTVTGARLLPDRRSVRLRTSPQISGREYTITLGGLRDASAAANQMPQGSRIPFVAWEPEEEPGPFASWWDVKRDFGAAGDGTTDDTDAWQLALDSLGFSGNNPQPKAVLHVPAGTYRITRTLEFRSRFGASVVGEDPATTVLRWDGPDDGVLLWVDGTRNTRVARLTLDGRSRALSLIDQKRSNGQWPPSENEFSDLILRDAKNGIRAGVDQLDSEVAVLRCQFLRCSETGIRFESFNAVDWWIWDSLFELCRHGVANPGGGEGHLYRCLFLRSTESDIAIQQCGSVAYRHNTSVESKAFLIQTCGALTTVHGNTILDPTEPTPIRMAGGSTLFLADNVIRTRPEHAGHPVVSGMGQVTALGNVFNASVPIAPGGPIVAHDNQVLPREQIVVDDHELPGFRVRRTRTIFEIPPPRVDGDNVQYATAEDIQAAIDQAATLAGQRPIVHLPYGDIFLDRTLIIPAGSDLQLVGDDFGTRLLWRARTNGTVLRVDGPSRATLRGFTVYGNSESSNFASAHGLEINHVDQPGSRLLADQLRVGGSRLQPNLVFDRLDHLESEFRGAVHSGAFGASSIVAIGGPRRDGAFSRPPLAAFFGGASSDSSSNYEVLRGAHLLIQDFWYEGITNGFLRLTGDGSLTLHGAIVAPSKLEPLDADLPPAVELAGFQGSLALLHADFRRPVQEILIQPPGTGAHFLMANSLWPLGAPNPAPSGATAAWFNNRTRHSGDPADLGSTDPAWVEAMLRDTREARPSLGGPIPVRGSDVRLHRINIINPGRGLLVTGSNAPPIFASVTNQILAEGDTLSLGLSASDPDQPFQTLRFFLDSAAPFGVSVDPQSGQFTWRTLEDQGPADYVIPIHVADDGSPPRIATLPLRVTVTERNEAPRLGIPGQRLDPAPLTSQDIGIAGDPRFPGSLTENPDGSLELIAGGSEARFAEDFLHFAHREITGDFDVRAKVAEFDFLHGGARAGIMVRDQLDRRSAALFLAVNPEDPEDNDEYTFYRRSAFGADTDFPGHRSRGVPHPNAWMRLVRSGDRFTAFRSVDGTEWVDLGRYETAGTLPPTVFLGLWGVSLYNFTEDGRLRARFDSFEVRVPDVVPVPAQILDEGSSLRLSLTAVDPDLPAQTLRFDLGPGAPEGVVVDPTTGALTWTPSEAQAPGDYSIPVTVTDDGIPPRSQTLTIPVAVRRQASAIPDGFTSLTVPTRSGDLRIVLPRRHYEFRATRHTRYLAPNGTDLGPGSLEQPWLTITHALSQLGAGDVLYLRAGEYPEPFLVSKSGTEREPIIISAFPGERVRIIQPPGWQATHPNEATVTLRTAKYVWIHSLEIEGCLGQPDAPPPDTFGQNGLSLENGAGEGCRILNNRISRAQHCGIKELSHGGTDFLIEGNVIFENGVGGQDHGIYVGSRGRSGIVIRGNAVFRNASYGLHAYAEPSANHIYNNLLFENGAAGIIEAGSANVLAHNVCAFNAQLGGFFLFRGGCRSNLFVNNISFANASHQFTMDNGGGVAQETPAHNTLDHSIAFPAQDWAQPIAYFTAFAGSHLMLIDPRFENSAGYDFRLRPSSPGRSNAAAVRLIGTAPSPDLGLFPATLYWEPVLIPVPDQILVEGKTFETTLHLEKVPPPGTTLSFDWVGPAPAWATLDPSTGSIRWQPTESQGPGTSTFEVAVKADASPLLIATTSFKVRVEETNAAPILESIPPISAVENEIIHFTAVGMDPDDVPSNALAYFAEDLPTGAQLDPATGRFSWTPTASQVGEHTLRIVVRDDGIPTLSASRTVLIRVQAGTPPRLESVDRVGGQLRFRWSTRSGTRYRVQAADSLVPATWQDVREVIATGDHAEYTESFEDASHRYFRVVRDP
ncbi:MAG: putative Ig domain-containing protein [Verrucomicrobiales bacterium]|nr:putative Ig domain-containing protein [Verrucomicrobiales bacterium]